MPSLFVVSFFGSEQARNINILWGVINYVFVGKPSYSRALSLPFMISHLAHDCGFLFCSVFVSFVLFRGFFLLRLFLRADDLLSVVVVVVVVVVLFWLGFSSNQ